MTGYVLTVRREANNGNCGGGDLAELGLECDCINITNPVGCHTLEHGLFKLS